MDLIIKAMKNFPTVRTREIIVLKKLIFYYFLMHEPDIHIRWYIVKLKNV